MKPTVYKQFVGGTSISDCQAAVRLLEKYRVKAILDYSVEGGYGEKQIEETLTVYPNPAVDFLNVDLSGNSDCDMEIRIFDTASGRLYNKEIIKKNSAKISYKVGISHYPPGIYILEVKQGNNHSFHKIAKVN